MQTKQFSEGNLQLGVSTSKKNKDLKSIYFDPEGTRKGRVNYPKANRKKEIIKIKVVINKIKTKQTIKKINELKR